MTDGFVTVFWEYRGHVMSSGYKIAIRLIEREQFSLDTVTATANLSTCSNPPPDDN